MSENGAADGGDDQDMYEERLPQDADINSIMERIAQSTADRVADKTNEAMRTISDRMLQSVERKLEEHVVNTDKKLEEFERRLDLKNSQRFEALERRMDASERSGGASSVVSSLRGSASAFGGAGAAASSGVQREPFTPKQLEVKGFVAYGRIQEEGLVKDECGEWLDKLKGAMGGAADKVHWEKTKLVNKKPLAYAITVIATDRQASEPDGCWNLRKIVDPLLAGLSPPGKSLWVNCEAPPWKRPYIRAGGKSLAVMQRLGIQKAQLDPVWKALFELWYKAAATVQVAKPRPVKLLQWKPEGWTLFADAIKLALPEAKLEDIHKQLEA